MISQCIQKDQRTKQNDDNQRLKKKRYLIENTNNLQCYESLRLLVSQPLKYLAVHVLIICCMIYFYVLTFVTGLIVIQLNYVIIALHILVFIFFAILGFKNPGIVLKINEDFDTQTKLQIPFDRDAKPAINQLSKSYLFPIKSHFISLRFCPQCLIYKPPRAVHCWICNACIKNMDHHCPFIGNCVGKGNYQIFFCFVSALGCMLLLIIIQLIILIVRLFSENHSDAFKKPQLYFAFILGKFRSILVVFALVVLVFVWTLGVFHVYLITNNVTTNQLCKETWNTLSGNPFKKNFFTKNIFRFIRGSINQRVPNQKQQLHKSMVPRFKDKSQEYLSSYSNQSPPVSSSQMKQQELHKVQDPQQESSKEIHNIQSALTSSKSGMPQI